MIVVVDVEADGPCPGIYSMIQYGAVVIYDNKIMGQVTKTLKPITDYFVQEALDAIGVTRERTLEYGDAALAMNTFEEFLMTHMSRSKSKSVFYSDNNGFDWQFVNYYFHHFGDYGNPFGFSSNNISNIYGGLTKKTRNYDWKRYRITPHTHDALSDALGNAEALLTISRMYNLSLI